MRCNRKRRRLGCYLLALSIATLCSVAPAQSANERAAFPSHPLKLVVGASPGGNVDVTARIVGKRLGEVLGQPVVIENRPGAGGAVAFNAVRQARGDAYTLLLAPTGFTTAPALNPSAGYNPVEDFTAISTVSYLSYAVAVSADSPYRSLAELLAAAKARPDTLGYGTGGVGSGQHLVAELLSSTTGAKFVHTPYRGGSAPLTDLIAGHIPMLVEIESVLEPQVSAGKVRVLAITGPTRSVILPDTPTMIEAGVRDFVVEGWLGMLAPRGIAPEVVAKLNTALRQALSDPETIAALKKGGAVPRASSPEEFAALIAKETKRWAEVIRGAAIKPQ